MLKRLRSWFRRPEPELPAVTFARQVGQVLEWWLIGFGEQGTAAATDLRVLEAAMGLNAKALSVRAAASELAHILCGDIILSQPAAVRDETLAYIRRPEISQQLLSIRSSDVVMMPDLIYGFAMDDPGVTAALRPKMYADVIERIPAAGISPAAHHLYAAIRHLWERALVAVRQEEADTTLRENVRILIDDTLYALEGEDFDKRQQRRLESAIAMFSKSVFKDTAPDDANA